MKNENFGAPSGNFSNDPEENLHLENEILHLKLKAELGGELISNTALPPEIENKFLKNIIDFEGRIRPFKQVKIFDLLGQPKFRKSIELADDEIEEAFHNMCALLEEKNIVLEFSGEYDIRLKYCFLTEELLDKETDDIQIPGLVMHYCYEEFHPNHQSDIESRCIAFVAGWFDQQIDEDDLELADDIILPNGTVLSKKEVISKIDKVFAAYTEFKNAVYDFYNIKFELKENELTGMGYVEGSVSFDAVLESGEIIHLEGPVKLYLSMENQWWSIFYFIFPGFQWEYRW